MPLIQSGVALEMVGAENFIKQGKAVDAILLGMSKAADKAVDSVLKVNNVLSKLTIPKSFTDFDPKNISKLGDALEQISEQTKGSGITFFAKKLDNLFDTLERGETSGEISRDLGSGLQKLAAGFRSFTTGKTIDKLPVQLSAINKEFPKLVTTLENLDSTNDGLEGFVRNAVLLGDGLIPLAKGFRALTNQFSADNLKTSITEIRRALADLQGSFQRLSSTDFINNLETISNALLGLGKVISSIGNRSKSFAKFPVIIEQLVEGIKKLEIGDFEDLLNIFERLAPRLEELATIGRALNLSFKNFNKTTVTSKKNTDKLTISLSGLSNVSKRVTTGFNVLVGSTRLIFKVVKPLVPLFINLGKSMLALPIKFISTSLQTLRKVFISLPIAAVTKTFNLFTSVIKGFFSSLNSVVKGLISIERNIKRIKKAISILLTPFRLLIKLVQSLFAGLTKLISILNVFNRSSTKTKSNIEQTNKVLERNTQVVQKNVQQMVVLERQVEQTGRIMSIAKSAFVAFAAALGARGIAIGVKRLINLQLTMRSLSVLSNVVSGGVRTITSTISRLTQTAFDAAANFESLRLSVRSAFAREAVQEGTFSTITEAIDNVTPAADRLLQRIRLLAIASPFNRETLANVFLAARNFGFASDSAEGLTAIMSNLGAALGLNSQDMTEVIRALGQIRSAGVALTQDLRQIGDRGVPIFEQLAKNMNVSVGELRNLISEGKVSAVETINAFTDIGRSVEGQAALATTSLKGLFATFQDFRSDALRNLFTPIFEPLQQDFSNILTVDNLNAGISVFTKLGESIGKIVVPAVRQLIFVISNIQDIIAGIPQPVLNGIISFGTFAATLISVSLGMGALQAAIGLTLSIFLTFLNPISLGIGLFAALATQSGTLSNVLISLKDTSLGLVTGSVTMNQALMNVKDTLMLLPNPLTLISNALRVLQQDFMTVFGGLVTTVQTSINSIITFFGNSLSAVTTWGANIVQAFSQGILNTLGTVADALSALGDLLAFWLAPGSPPRIAPEIDKWGQSTAKEYLDGFSSADFSAISEFGSTVEDLLETLDISGIDTSNLVEGFSELIRQVNETGSFSEETFAQLIANAQGAEVEVAALANNFLTLQVEQAKLNDLTKKYDDELSSVDDTIASIEGRQAFKDEQKRIGEINRRLQNTNLSVEQRSALETELQKIEAQRNKRTLQEEKRVAENRIKSAQEDIDTTKERIRLAQQFGEENQLAGATGVTGDVGSTGRLRTPKIKKGKKLDEEDIAPGLNDALKAANKRLTNFAPNVSSGITAPLSQLTGSLAGTQNKVSELTKNVQARFTEIKTNVQSTIDTITGKFTEWGFTIERVRLGLAALGLLLASPLVIGAITALATAAATLTTPFGLVAGAAIALSTAFGVLVFQSGGLPGALDTITGAFDRFKSAITIGANVEGGSIIDSLTSIDITSINSVVDGVGLAIGNLIETIKSFSLPEFDFGTNLTELFTFDTETLTNTLTNAVGAILLILGATFFTPLSIGLLTSVGPIGLTGIVTSIFTLDESEFSNPAAAFVDNLLSFISDNIYTPIINAFTSNDTVLGSLKDSYIGIFTSLFNDLVPEDASSFVENITTFLNESGIGQVIENEFRGLFGDIDLSDSIVGLNDSIQTILDSLQSVADFFSSTGTIISEGFTTVQTTIDTLSENEFVIAFLGNLRDAFIKLGQELTDSELLSELGELATTLGVFLAASIGTTVVLLQTVLVPVLRNIGDVVETAVKFINNLVDAFVLVGTGVIKLIQGDISGLATIFEGIGAAALSVVELITSLGSNLGQLLLDATINVADLIGFDTGVLQERADELFESFRETFSVDNVKSKLEDFSFQDVIDSIFEFEIPFTDGDETVGGIFDSISEGFDKIVESFNVDLNNPFEAVNTVVGNISGVLETISGAYDILAEKLRTEFPSPIGEPLALAAEGLSVSFETISNLIETIRRVFAGELKNPFSAIADSIQPITEFFDTVQDKLAGLSASFSNFEFPEFPNPFAEIQEGIRSTGEFFGFVDEDITPDVSINSDGIESELEEAGNKAIDAFAGSFSRPDIPIRIQDNVNRVLDDVNTDELVALAESVGIDVSSGILAGLNAEDGANTEVQTFITALVTALQAQAQISSPSQLTLTEVGIPLGQGILDGIIQAFSTGSEQIRIALQSLFSGLTSSAEGNTLQTFLNVSEQVSAFTMFREQSIDELENMVSDYLKILNEFTKNGIKELIEFVDDSVDKLGEFIEFIEEDVIDSINSLLRSLAQLKSRGTNEIRSFVNRSEQELIRLRDIFRTIGEQAVDQLVDALRSLSSRTTTIIRSQISSIQASLGTGPTSAMGRLGMQLGDDLESGILEGIGTIDITMGNALIREIQKALERARRATGTFSPSRLFKQRLGEPIGEGVTEGAGDITKELSDVITDSLQDTIASASRGLRLSFRRLDRTFQTIQRSFGRGIPNPIPNELVSELNQVINILSTDINTPLMTFDDNIQAIDMSLISFEGTIGTLIDRLNDLGDTLSRLREESGGGDDIVVGPITPVSSLGTTSTVSAASTASATTTIEVPVRARFVLDEEEIEAQAAGLALQVSESLEVSIADNLNTENIGANFGALLTSANANEVLESSKELGKSVSTSLIDGINDELDETEGNDVIDSINDIISSALESSDALDNALSNIQTFSETSIELMSEFVENTIEDLEIFIEFIQEQLTTALEEFVEILEELLAVGLQIINQFILSAEIALQRLIVIFRTVGVQSVNALVTALQALSAQVISEINKQLNIIIDELQAGSIDNQNAPFYVLGDNLGVQLAEGIITGIEGSAFGITNAIVNEVRKAINNAQVQLGIASPSKLSKTEIGIPVGQGIPVGVSETESQMTNQMINSVMSSLTNARKPILDNVSTFQNSLMNQLTPLGSPAIVLPIPNINNNLEFSTAQLERLSNTSGTRTSALSTTQIRNMQTSNTNNSRVATNNYNMSITTTDNGAAKVKRNFRRMKMIRTIK